MHHARFDRLQRICGLLDREEIDRGRFLGPLTRHMAQFAESYLRQQNVHPLMDVAFSVNGKLYDTFSCERLVDFSCRHRA